MTEHLTKLAILAAVLATSYTCQPAYAQTTLTSNWSIGSYAGLHDAGLITQYQIGTVKKLFDNPKLFLELDSFAGLTFDTQNPFAGFGAEYSNTFALDIQWYAGLGYTISQSKISGFGLILGLRTSFAN